MNFDTLCNESILKLTKQISEDNQKLNQIKENPEMILTELFDGNGCYNQLTNTIKTFGKEFTVHDFQKYTYSLLIPFLKNTLGEHYDFSFYENSYSSGLNICFDEYELAMLNIYNRSVHLWQPLYIETIKNNLEDSKDELYKKEQLLKKFEDAGMNPFKVCSNPIDWLYFIFQFKTYKSKVEYVKNSIKKGIGFYTEQIEEDTCKLEEQILSEYDIKTYTQEIIDYFRRYGYKVTKSENR